VLKGDGIWFNRFGCPMEAQNLDITDGGEGVNALYRLDLERRVDLVAVGLVDAHELCGAE
jgi:hypothetical protein